MKRNFKKKLKQEISYNTSGRIVGVTKIPILKEKHYCIIPFNLDGDAPKRFIKAYFFESGGKVYKSKFKSWNFYIAKSAQKWYPHESVIEYILNRIGIDLGLNMNNVKIARVNGQIRFLSQYFLNREIQNLIHGAEICGEYLEDNEMAKEIAEDKNSARELFTIQFIFQAIQSVFPDCCNELKEELIKMIVFDAIIGNNDRHYYNWGIIKSIRKDGESPRFSPIYDTARGLLWNWSDERVKTQLSNLQSGGKQIEKYIQHGCPRISIEGDADINHFKLIGDIYSSYTEYRGTISSLISLENEKKVITLYNLEFKQYFIPERNELIEYILRERFKRLRLVAN